MIELTKLTGEIYFLNPNHIESIESTPDTMLTMTNGKKYYAKDNIPDVINKIKDFYRQVFPLIRVSGIGYAGNGRHDSDSSVAEQSEIQ